ncbi:MAG TPA: hypothetical protein VGV92_00980 [Gammaproteobacteria bacterium]|nr:hypothetical protein [Gammaproteobacteria bacterium]
MNESQKIDPRVPAFYAALDHYRRTKDLVKDHQNMFATLLAQLQSGQADLTKICFTLIYLAHDIRKTAWGSGAADEKDLREILSKHVNVEYNAALAKHQKKTERPTHVLSVQPQRVRASETEVLNESPEIKQLKMEKRTIEESIATLKIYFTQVMEEQLRHKRNNVTRFGAKVKVVDKLEQDYMNNFENDARKQAVSKKAAARFWDFLPRRMGRWIEEKFGFSDPETRAELIQDYFESKVIVGNIAKQLKAPIGKDFEPRLKFSMGDKPLSLSCINQTSFDSLFKDVSELFKKEERLNLLHNRVPLTILSEDERELTLYSPYPTSRSASPK